MPGQDDIRKRLKKALEEAAQKVDHLESITLKGCCEVRVGKDIVERRGGVRKDDCTDIANLFGGIPDFKEGVSC